MFQRDSPWEECTFTRTWSILDKSTCVVVICLGLGVIFGLATVSRELGTIEFALPCVERKTSITTSHRSRAGKPTIRNPASKDMISDSVELWDADVSCTSNSWRQMFGFRIEHKTPSRGWFWILNVPAKSESWKNPNRQCSAVFPTLTILTVVICVMNVWNYSGQTSVTSLSPFCDWSGKFVDWPQNVRSTNSGQVQAFPNDAHTSDNSPTDSSSSFLFWWSSKQGLETWNSCSAFCSPNRNNCPRIFEHVLLRHTPCFIPIMNNLTFSVSLVLLEAFQNGCIFPYCTMCLTVSFALPWWICHGFFSVFLPRFFFIGT